MSRLDRDEFTVHVAQNRHAMMKIARSMLPERDCEDAVQSAVLSAWEHLPQLRDEHAFDAWLKQILINQCRQIQRRYARERDTCAALSDARRRDREENAALDEALESLNTEERRLIRLHHEYGYTLKEISASSGLTEDVLKMRLYRARKRLKTAFITLLLILLAAVAVGSGLLDVDWFLKNRWGEPAEIESSMIPGNVEFTYEGKLLDFAVSDAIWNRNELSMTFVYSIAGLDKDAVTICNSNLGVDGVRSDHVWVEDEILPVDEWVQGRLVWTYDVDGWRLGGRYMTGTEDDLPDGKGQTFLAELRLDRVKPEEYKTLMDADGTLAFTAVITLRDYQSGEVIEMGTAVIRLSAPDAEEWRAAYEAYHR